MDDNGMKRVAEIGRDTEEGQMIEGRPERSKQMHRGKNKWRNCKLCAHM